ncbi:ribonuclease III domain-containing protein [Apiospora phragmitis]|uniref:Ribonuclease III domain-containing protein n=1 Tax=Apiospora phragmitis TaxID=2905665 RepID=A0ABR1WW19_9PEZI
MGKRGKASKAAKRALDAAAKALALEKSAEKSAVKTAGKAAKKAAAAEAEEAANTTALPSLAPSTPPPPPAKSRAKPPKPPKPEPAVAPAPWTPRPGQTARICPKPLHRYPFFTPASPLILNTATLPSSTPSTPRRAKSRAKEPATTPAPWRPRPGQTVRIIANSLYDAFFTPASPPLKDACAAIVKTIRTTPETTTGKVTRAVTVTQILGYTFTSKVILAEALNVAVNSEPRHQFSVDGGGNFYLPSSKRLAIYGDSLMRTYLCRKWLELGPVLGTGVLWSTRSSVVLSDEHLSGIFLKLNLERCITRDMDSVKSYLISDKKNPKYMSTTVEAIAAAAFLDGGDEALSAIMSAFGFDKWCEDGPTMYDFIRHRQPEANEGADSGVLIAPSANSGAPVAPSANRLGAKTPA